MYLLLFPLSVYSLLECFSINLHPLTHRTSSHPFFNCHRTFLDICWSNSFHICDPPRSFRNIIQYRNSILHQFKSLPTYRRFPILFLLKILLWDSSVIYLHNISCILSFISHCQLTQFVFLILLHVLTRYLIINPTMSLFPSLDWEILSWSIQWTKPNCKLECWNDNITYKIRKISWVLGPSFPWATIVCIECRNHFYIV